MWKARRSAAFVLVLPVAAIGTSMGDVATHSVHTPSISSSPVAEPGSQPFPVSGSAIIFTSTEMIHSVEPTATGMIQQSSVAGQMNGDLNGSILFNATSTFDFVDGTLVNTGTQFFSGTVAGSSPVVLHDDSFRFEIDLNTGATLGTVHFSRSQDAPHKGRWFDCDLAIIGTGVTADGDLTSDYSGECIRRGTDR